MISTFKALLRGICSSQYDLFLVNVTGVLGENVRSAIVGWRVLYMSTVGKR